MTRPVLLIAQTGTFGGAERVLLDWSRALERPVRLACPDGPLAVEARAAGHDVALLPARALRRRGRTVAAALDLGALAADIARLARRTRPDAIVASGVRPVLAAAAAPRGGAALVTVHHDLPAGAWLRAIERVATARATASIATSAAIAARLGGPAVIHPGVDLAHWAGVDPPPGAARALVLGALVPWKRPDLALEIAARLPGLTLTLAGAELPGDPPAFASALRERAGRADLAGRVRFLGALADPREALREADCLLHCAYREPFGLALVEALAAGRPVVAAAAAGPLEIVTPDCGRLYPPGDVAGGAAALGAVLADPAVRDGARARAAMFDGAASARRFAAAVERAIARVAR